MSEEYDDQEELFDDETFLEDEDQDVGATPAWIMSLAVHGMLLLIMGAIYFGANLPDDPPPIRITYQDQPPAIIDKKEKPRELEEKPLDVEDPVLSDDPQVTTLDIEVEPVETEDTIEEEPTEPKGREEANADVETGGAAAFMAMGAGGGASEEFVSIISPNRATICSHWNCL